MIYLNKILLHRPLPEESYLHTLPAVRWLSQTGALTFPAPVTFFVGENGTGKSTLLEAIAVACGFNAEGGSKNFSFSTFRSHSPLHESLTPSRLRRERDGFFLRAESFYNVATNIEEMDREIADVPYISASPLVYSYGGVSLHGQSHGESFLSLVQNRFGGQGLYLLDEPESALSPTRQLALLAEIHRLVQADSQFLIATHSPILMAYPGAYIWQFSETGLEAVSYEETEHYQLTRRFLENPQRYLAYLFQEKEESSCPFVN